MNVCLTFSPTDTVWVCEDSILRKKPPVQIDYVYIFLFALKENIWYDKPATGARYTLCLMIINIDLTAVM